MQALGKLFTAMVTPFDADLRVDCERAAGLAARWSSAGSRPWAPARVGAEIGGRAPRERLEQGPDQRRPRREVGQ